jgi:hypothetical protein
VPGGLVPIGHQVLQRHEACLGPFFSTAAHALNFDDVLIVAARSNSRRVTLRCWRCRAVPTIASLPPSIRSVSPHPCSGDRIIRGQLSKLRAVMQFHRRRVQGQLQPVGLQVRALRWRSRRYCGTLLLL